MLKTFFLALILYGLIALPAFYIISGEITWEMIWQSGTSFIAAVLIIYFLSRKKLR